MMDVHVCRLASHRLTNALGGASRYVRVRANCLHDVYVAVPYPCDDSRNSVIDVQFFRLVSLAWQVARYRNDFGNSTSSNADVVILELHDIDRKFVHLSRSSHTIIDGLLQ